MRHLQTLILIVLFFSFCSRNKAPLQPEARYKNSIPTRMPQHDIPWPTLADSPWPMLGHDPQHTCRSPYKGPQKGELEWNSKPFDSSVRSGIAIGMDNTIYYYIYVYLMAINEDGSEKWRLACEQRYATILIASDNTIYASSYDNNFYAINSDGTLKWKIYLAAAAGSPTIGLDGTLYTVSPNKNTLYAIKGASLLWSLKLGSGFQGECPAFSPDGATLYVAGVDSSLYALTTSGSVKWKRKFGRFWIGPMIDAQGNIYLMPRGGGPRGVPSKLVSLDSDGTVRWEFQYSASGDESQGLTMDKNGYIYLDAWRKIISVDYAGNVRWETPYPDPIASNGAGLMCDMDGTIYYGTGAKQNGVIAVSSTGVLKWTAAIDADPFGPPEYEPVLGKDGKIYRNAVSGRGIYCIK